MPCGKCSSLGPAATALGWKRTRFPKRPSGTRHGDGRAALSRQVCEAGGRRRGPGAPRGGPCAQPASPTGPEPPGPPGLAPRAPSVAKPGRPRDPGLRRGNLRPGEALGAARGEPGADPTQPRSPGAAVPCGLPGLSESETQPPGPLRGAPPGPAGPAAQRWLPGRPGGGRRPEPRLCPARCVAGVGSSGRRGAPSSSLGEPSPGGRGRAGREASSGPPGLGPGARQPRAALGLETQVRGALGLEIQVRGADACSGPAVLSWEGGGSDAGAAPLEVAAGAAGTHLGPARLLQVMADLAPQAPRTWLQTPRALRASRSKREPAFRRRADARSPRSAPCAPAPSQHPARRP